MGTKTAENKEKEELILGLHISFPKAPKEREKREALFNKFLSLIEENKESLHVEIKSDKRKRDVILDSDEFMFVISFGKKIPLAHVFVHEPEKNLDTANEFGNKFINYLNTILGEYAIESHVDSHKTISYPKIDLSRKIIGEMRIAKINEKVKQTLSPVSVLFEYKINNREFAFATTSTEQSVLLSRIIYKDKLPFDLLQIECNELENPANIIKKLIEEEL